MKLRLYTQEEMIRAGGEFIPTRWTLAHDARKELSCELLRELGYDPNDVLARNADDGALEVNGGRLVLEVLDRDSDGGVQILGGHVAHHVGRVKVDPKRMAQYLADLDAANTAAGEDPFS